MKNKNLLFSLLTCILLIFFTSCSDDQTIIDQPEVVTEEPTPDTETETETDTDTDTESESESESDTSTESESEPETKALDFITKIKVITHAGHLHGETFHANGQPETSPFRRMQYFYLQRNEDGSWNYLNNDNPEDKNYLSAGKPVVMEGIMEGFVSYSTRYAFEFKYYNKDGKEVNADIHNQKKMYQTLFSVESYKENETETVFPVENTKDFFDYTRRDTNPADKMIKEEGVTLEDNFLGFKGYALTMKNKISYTLKVDFVKFNTENDKKESVYLEDANQEQIEDKITIEIPIIIPVGRGADDYVEIFAAYFNMTPDDFETYDIWGDYDPEASPYWM